LPEKRDIRIVLDTSCIVSGLLKASSYSGLILRLVAEGEVRVVYDPRILIEYRDVLLREKFGFDKGGIEDVLNQLRGEGLLITPKPLHTRLPDESDRPFLEAACATDVPLVTGNKRHFPEDARKGVMVLSPKEFIEVFFAPAHDSES